MQRHREIPQESVEPSHAYSRAVDEETDRQVDQALAQGASDVVRQETYQGQRTLWDAANTAGEELRTDLEGLAFDLHDHPETAFEEHHARAAIYDLLARHGVEADLGVYGVETALEARFSTADFDPSVDPSVAILAEYDALPGLGHACGHNVIAAAGVGAFLAAKKALESKPGARGRIVLLGTPAEEGHTGKEYMIREGAFDRIDAAVMVHPHSMDVSEHYWVGRRSVTAQFHGVAAHASMGPFDGRNALDAASLAYQGTGLLRQQMPPSDRLHAVITNGGTRPSIIPDESEVVIYVRSLLTDSLSDLSSRIDDILDGAALMAGVGVTRRWDEHPPSLPVRNNHAMARRWRATQELRGRHSLPPGVLPDSMAASTDFGNVSHLIPGIHPLIALAPEGVGLHSAEFAKWARTPKAVDAAVDAAIGLAQVSLDLINEEGLLPSAVEEFEQASGVVRP